MIRLLDGPTALTSEDVIGKFILTEGVFNFRSYRKPGKVTSITKTGLYINYEPINLGSDAIDVEAQDERRVATSSVRAICDTEDEARAIIEASKVALKISQDHQEACKQEIDNVFAMVVRASGGAENE